MPKKTTRKRTSEASTSAEAATQGLQSADQRDPNEGKRRERVPLGQGMNLGYPSGFKPDLDNFYYRWIAEHPGRAGRLDSASGAGYEMVTNPEGSPYTRATGDGKFYFVKLPIEYREDDLALKRQRATQMLDEQTRLGRNEYAPDEKGRAEGGTSSIVSRRETDNPFAA